MKNLLKILLSTFICQYAIAAEYSNDEVLHKIWATGSHKACTQDMRSAFDEKSLAKIKLQLGASNNIDDLAAVLNPFLFSLGWSHTEFMTTSNEGYYLFKSHEAMTHSKLPPAPEIINPGVQVGKDQGGYFIREVLSGFPAERVGIKKNDRILSVDGAAFKGVWPSSEKAVVKLEREGKPLEFELVIKPLNWSQAFEDATKNSVKIFKGDAGQKIGYIHLWSGVHPESAALLMSSVIALKKDHVASLILDLRGGYGGAWWEHLDPFFADTKSYMQMEATTSDGKTEIIKSPFKKNKNFFSGPMVVLINEGVRSGKEALAYQFKKTKRAFLIGDKTPGYFSTGQYFYADEALNYILYLCVFRVELDGHKIEGVGIEPDETILYKSSDPIGDTQLSAGLKFLSRK